MYFICVSFLEDVCCDTLGCMNTSLTVIESAEETDDARHPLLEPFEECCLVPEPAVEMEAETTVELEINKVCCVVPEPGVEMEVKTPQEIAEYTLCAGLPVLQKILR